MTRGGRAGRLFPRAYSVTAASPHLTAVRIILLLLTYRSSHPNFYEVLTLDRGICLTDRATARLY